MAVEKGFRRLPGISLHEPHIGMRQDQAEEGDLLTLPADLDYRLAEVDLGMARRVMERNESLARRLADARVRAECGDHRTHPRPLAACRLSTPENRPFNARPGYILPAGRRPMPPYRKETAMTAQTLPDEPNFCFCPAYDVETDVQQIRIVIEGLSGHVPTALVALDLDDALSICDKLNRRIGYDRKSWTAMAAASMHAEDDEPEGGSWH